MKLFISSSVDATANNDAEDAVGVKREHGAGVERDAIGSLRAVDTCAVLARDADGSADGITHEHGASVARHPSTLQLALQSTLKSTPRQV